MRNTIVGVIFAAIFLAALFVAAHHSPAVLGNRTASNGFEQPHAIRPGFVFVQRTGNWTLECLKPRKIPEWMIRQAEGMAGSHEQPQRRRPPVCHVITDVKAAGDPSRWIQVIFNLVARQGFLTALMRIAPDLAGPGDYLDLHLSQEHLKVRVSFCGLQECIAVPVSEPQLIANPKGPLADDIVASREAVLSFPSASGTRPISFTIPMKGLQPAIAAFRAQTGNKAR